MENACDRAQPWFEESLEVARRIDDRWCLMRVLNAFGICEAQLGRIDRGKALLAEGLRLAAAQGAVGYYTYLIGGFDLVARCEGRMHRAGRLWAAACADLVDTGSAPAPKFAQTLGLDEASAQRDWTAGRSLTIEQRIAYALSDED